MSTSLSLQKVEEEARDLYIHTKAHLDDLEKMWRKVYVAHELRVWYEVWAAASVYSICPDAWQAIPMSLRKQYNHAVQMHTRMRRDGCDDGRGDGVDGDGYGECDVESSKSHWNGDGDGGGDDDSISSHTHTTPTISLTCVPSSHLEDDLAVYASLVHTHISHTLSTYTSSLHIHSMHNIACMRLMLSVCKGIQDTYTHTFTATHTHEYTHTHPCNHQYIHHATHKHAQIRQDTICMWICALGVLQKSLYMWREDNGDGNGGYGCMSHYRIAQALVLFIHTPGVWREFITHHIHTECMYIHALQNGDGNGIHTQCLYVMADSMCRENELVCSIDFLDNSSRGCVCVCVQDIEEVCTRVSGMLSHIYHTHTRWYIQEAHDLLTLAFNSIQGDGVQGDDVYVMACTYTLAYVYFKLAQLRILQHTIHNSNNAYTSDSVYVHRLSEAVRILSGDTDSIHRHTNALKTCQQALHHAHTLTGRQQCCVWLRASAILLLQSSMVVIGKEECAYGLGESANILTSTQLGLPGIATILSIRHTHLLSDALSNVDGTLLGSICDVYVQVRKLEMTHALTGSTALSQQYRMMANILGSMTHTSALNACIQLSTTSGEGLMKAAWRKYVDSCVALITSVLANPSDVWLDDYFHVCAPTAMLALSYELYDCDSDFSGLLQRHILDLTTHQDNNNHHVEYRHLRQCRELLATSDRTSLAAVHAHQYLLLAAQEGSVYAAQLYGQAMLLYLLSASCCDDEDGGVSNSSSTRVCIHVADAYMMAGWFAAQAHDARKQKQPKLSRANSHLAIVLEHLAGLHRAEDTQGMADYHPVLRQLYLNLNAAFTCATNSEPAEITSRPLDFSANETPLQLLWWRYLYGSRSVRLFFDFAEAFLFFPHDQSDASTHPPDVVHTLCTMLLTRLQIKPCDTFKFLNANDYLRACRETGSGGEAINNDFVEARVVGWSLDPFASSNSVSCIKRFLLLLHCVRKLCSWTGNIQSILEAYGFEFFGLLSVLLRTMLGVLKPILGKGGELEQQRLLEQRMLFSLQALLSLTLGTSTVPYLALRGDKVYGSAPYQFFQLFNEGLDPLLEAYASSEVEEQQEMHSMVNFEPVLMQDDLAWNKTPLQREDFCYLTAPSLIVWLQDLSKLSGMLVTALDQQIDTEELGELVHMMMKFVVVIQQDSLRSLSLIIQQEPSQLSLVKDMNASSLILRYADPLDANSLFQFVDFNHLVLERAMLTVMWYSACLQAGQGLAYAKSFEEETKALLASTTSLFTFSVAVVESDMRQRDVVVYLLQHASHHPIHTVSCMALDMSCQSKRTTTPALTPLAQAYWTAMESRDAQSSLADALPASFLRNSHAADMSVNTVFDPLWALQAVPSVRTMDQLFSSIHSLVVTSIDSQEHRELDILIETMISMCGAFKGGGALASFGEHMHLLQTLRFLCQLLLRYPQDAPQLFLEKTYWSLFLQELLAVADMPLSLVSSADMAANVVVLSSDPELEEQDDEASLLFYYKCLLADLLFICMDVAKVSAHVHAASSRNSKQDMVVASTEVDVTSDFLRNQRFHGMEVWYCFQWLTAQHQVDVKDAPASGAQDWVHVLAKALQCIKLLSKTKYISTPFLASAKVAVMTFVTTMMSTRPSAYWIEVFLDHEDRPDRHVIVLDALHDPVCSALAVQVLVCLLSTWEDIEFEQQSRRPGRLREALAHDILKRILKALRTRSESKRFYMHGVTNFIFSLAAAVRSTGQVGALLESYGPARTVHSKMFCWTRSRSRLVKELLYAVDAAVHPSGDAVIDRLQDLSMVGAVIDLIAVLTQHSSIFVDQLIKVTEVDEEDSAIDCFRSIVIAVCTTDDQARYLFHLLFRMLLGNVPDRGADFENCSEHFFENVLEPLVIVNPIAFLLLFMVLSMATEHLQCLVLRSLLYILQNDNMYYENLQAISRSKPCLLVLLTNHYDSLEKHIALLSDITLHILPATLRTHEHKHFMDTLLFSANQAAKDLLARVVLTYTRLADKQAVFLLKGPEAAIEVPQAIATRAGHYTVMMWIQIPSVQSSRLSLKLFSAQHRVLFSVLQAPGLGVLVHVQHEDSKLIVLLTCVDEVKSLRLCDTHVLGSCELGQGDQWLFVSVRLKPSGVMSNSTVKIAINQTIYERDITLPSSASHATNYLAIGGVHSLVNKGGLTCISGGHSTSDLFISPVYVVRKGVKDPNLLAIHSQGVRNFDQAVAEYTKAHRIALHISPGDKARVSLRSSTFAICYPNSQRLLREAVGLDSLFGFIQQACILDADANKVLEMFSLLHQVLLVLAEEGGQGVRGVEI
ncbi:hypothetical protein EON64_02910 [archaeon]|nr:MAG: hypothetical protein EON64_02910 [archaeon]